MLTRHLAVTRTARYHVLGEPEGAWSEVWYLLHGYGQRAADFLGACRVLEAPERLLVAPEGLSRFYVRGTRGDVGASWMTREDREHEVADYVAYLDALHRALLGPRAPEDVRVGVLGFSQGTATAARWCVLGELRPARLVLWASGFPPDLDARLVGRSLGDVPVDLVLGNRDPYLSAERGDEEVERLRARLPKVSVRRYDGGHELDQGTLVEITKR